MIYNIVFIFIQGSNTVQQIILYESKIFEKFIQNFLESKKIQLKMLDSCEFFNKDVNVFLLKFDTKTSFKLKYNGTDLISQNLSKLKLDLMLCSYYLN